MIAIFFIVLFWQNLQLIRCKISVSLDDNKMQSWAICLFLDDRIIGHWSFISPEENLLTFYCKSLCSEMQFICQQCNAIYLLQAPTCASLFTTVKSLHQLCQDAVPVYSMLLFPLGCWLLHACCRGDGAGLHSFLPAASHKGGERNVLFSGHLTGWRLSQPSCSHVTGRLFEAYWEIHLASSITKQGLWDSLGFERDLYIANSSACCLGSCARSQSCTALLQVTCCL